MKKYYRRLGAGTAAFLLLMSHTAAAEEKDSVFTLLPEQIPVQKYEGTRYQVDVYGSFTRITDEDGAAAVMDDNRLLYKRGTMIPVSTELDYLEGRMDQLVVDSITGGNEDAQYLSVLEENHRVEDYYDQLNWPEELSNSGIQEISSNLNTSDTVLMVRYTDNTVAAFNYLTGSLLFKDETEKKDLSFGEYVGNWVTDKWNQLVKPDTANYDEIRFLEEELKTNPLPVLIPGEGTGNGSTLVYGDQVAASNSKDGNSDSTAVGNGLPSSGVISDKDPGNSGLPTANGPNVNPGKYQGKGQTASVYLDVNQDVSNSQALADHMNASAAVSSGKGAGGSKEPGDGNSVGDTASEKGTAGSNTGAGAAAGGAAVGADAAVDPVNAGGVNGTAGLTGNSSAAGSAGQSAAAESTVAGANPSSGNGTAVGSQGAAESQKAAATQGTVGAQASAESGTQPGTGGSGANGTAERDAGAGENGTAGENEAASDNQKENAEETGWKDSDSSGSEKKFQDESPESSEEHEGSSGENTEHGESSSEATKAGGAENASENQGVQKDDGAGDASVKDIAGSTKDSGEENGGNSSEETLKEGTEDTDSETSGKEKAGEQGNSKAGKDGRSEDEEDKAEKENESGAPGDDGEAEGDAKSLKQAKMNPYLTLYRPETGEYELYNTDDFLNPQIPREELLSEKQKLEKLEAAGMMGNFGKAGSRRISGSSDHGVQYVLAVAGGILLLLFILKSIIDKKFPTIKM